MDLQIHGLLDELNTEKVKNLRLSDDISQIKEALDVNQKNPMVNHQEHTKVLIELSNMQSEYRQLKIDYINLKLEYEALKSKYKEEESDFSEHQEKSVRFITIK